MKDHRKCKHCENDNTNPNFCDFCGRPVHENFKEGQIEAPDIIKEEVTLQSQEKT
jgi:hypothetical protein